MQQRLGRYELVERIASGGQGIVWRARDTLLDRIVAIKVLNQPVADDPRYLESLQREARLAAGLVHPNITAVHDFQVEGDIAYIVMEYVPDTLSSHMQNGQPLAYQRVVGIGIQICRALSHAHAREIIHRDIKLQNILLSEEGNVKVSDFGIARALASSTRSSATGTMGTPFYMSPEQWGGARTDGRADIYSLGILLYEMLTGSVPFRAENIGAMYVQHRESAIPEISSDLGIPDAVEAVVRMALEKDPDSRFNSADAMANALQRSLNPDEAPERLAPTPDVAPLPIEPVFSPAASPPQSPPPIPPRREGGFNPRWLIFGGVGVLVLGVVLVSIVLMLNSQEGQTLADGTETKEIEDTSFLAATVEASVSATITAGSVETQDTNERKLPVTSESNPTLVTSPNPTATDVPTPAPTPIKVPTPAPTLIKVSTPIPDPIVIRKSRELIFGGLNWDSALVQNGVARYIVEHGYGYPTSQIEGATVPLFQELRKGNVDVMMEIWLPNQIEVWNAAIKSGEVHPAGKSLEDNWQSSFLIPGYIQDRYPELDSVEDLKQARYKSLFVEPDSGGRAVLIGCISGWGCRAVQDGAVDTGPGQIKGMGLEDHVVLRDPGTAGALASTIERAYAKEEPILFYYWGPTALAHKLDMRDLDQPDPSECRYNDPVFGCAFPHAEIMIGLNTNLLMETPELIPFFHAWDWKAEEQLAAEGWYGQNKDQYYNSEEAYSATGVWYLMNNDAWKDWVPAGVAANVEAALAKEGNF